MNEAAESPRHPAAEVAIIGGLALALALGIEASPWLIGPNRWLDALLTGLYRDSPVPVPRPLAFVFLACCAFLTPLALLHINGSSRRALAYLVAACLTCTFSLVLAFSGLWLSPFPPLIAGFWAGLGSFFHLAQLESKRRNTAAAASDRRENDSPAPQQKPDPADHDDQAPLDAAEDEWKEFRRPS